MQSDPGEKARTLLESVAEVGGAAIGGAVSFLAVGPVDAAGAGALAVLLTKSIAYAADKVMSGRERVRVGLVATIAVDRIRERVKQGDTPRPDFFDQEKGMQATGEQLFEGILLKSRDEYEEKKIQYMGRFFANLTFAPDVSTSVASLLIKTFERLTYRQLVFLALVHRVEKINVKNLRAQRHSNPELEALKREEMDLHGSDLGTLGLIDGAGPFDDKLSSLGMVLVKLGELRGAAELSSQIGSDRVVPPW